MKFTTLANGLRVMVDHVPNVRTAHVGILIDAGSQNEDPDSHGVAHALEHMLFRGTASFDERQINETFESHGGYGNAFTGQELTGYYAKVLDFQAADALRVLSEMIISPALPQDAWTIEQQAILEEWRGDEDQPQSVVHQEAMTRLWPDHPMGRPILGTPASISALTVDKMRTFIAEHYTPDRMTVGVVGNFDHVEVMEIIQQGLGKMQKPLGFYQRPSLGTPGRGIIQTRREVQQTSVSMHFPNHGIRTNGFRALQLAGTLLGGGALSKLFRELRQDRGLVYYVVADMGTAHEMGSFHIDYGCDPNNQDAAHGVVIREIERLQAGGLTDQEFELTRQRCIGDVLMSTESLHNRLIHGLASPIYWGQPKTPNDIVAELQALTKTEVIEAAKIWLDPDSAVVSIVCPR